MSEPVRSSIGPLTVGNIVSAAVRLYRDRFKTYGLIALRAGLWSIIPLIVQLILSLLLYKTLSPEDNADLPLQLFILPLSIFCGAKAITNSALISRLAFQELLYKPETVAQGRQTVQPKMWRLWWMQVLIGLLGGLLVLALGIPFFLVAFIPIIGVFIIFLAVLILPILLIWLYARVFVSEVPLVVEENLMSFLAIKRSWNLTQGSAWRIVWIITVGSLIMLPIWGLASIPFSVVIASASQLSDDTLNSDIPEQFTIALYGSILLFSLLNILFIPFWQSIKSLIYYDLRTRKEGLDLNLRDSNEI